MAYGLRHSVEYDTNSGDNAKLEIYKLGYTEGLVPLLLSGKAVEQHWQTDDPTAPIKGCTLEINLLSVGITLDDFYSASGKEFQVIHYLNNIKSFVGYLVQDDFSEDFIDEEHIITLQAADGLGLLKEVTFGDSMPDGFELLQAQGDYIAPIPENRIYLFNSFFRPAVGIQFKITGHSNSAMNITFTPLSVTDLGNGNYNILVTEFTGDVPAGDCQINGKKNFDIYSRHSLRDIIRVCLFNTDLVLPTYFYNDLFEQSQDITKGMLEQTFINCQIFLNDTKFNSCQDVLTRILERFEFTLFQSFGIWYIVRFGCLRYGSPLAIYDENFALVNVIDGAGGFSKTLGYNQTFYPEYVVNRKLKRPLKYSEETFNYKQPKYLLKNFDFHDLGALLNTYTTGSGINTKVIKEYEFLDWFHGPFAPQSAYFIRVTTDYLDNEIERVLVIKGGLATNGDAIVGIPIEVSQGDKVKLSFEFKTNNSQGGPITYIFVLKLTDGTTTRYADEVVGWKPGTGWNYTGVGSSDDTNTFHTVTINPSLQIPFDGLLYVYLPQTVGPSMNPSPDDETIIKDVRLEYTAYVNLTTKIIGHVHTYTQDADVKNKKELTVQIDDSPRNSILGTLYLGTFTGVIQDRTQRWYRWKFDDSERLRLGEIITTEDNLFKLTTRQLLEGTYYGINGIGLFNLVSYVPLTNKRFIYGYLKINFKKGSFGCTLYELFDTTEVPADDLSGEYTFKYLYDAK